MQWSLTYPQKPWTTNSERAGSKRGVGGHYGRAALVKEWRTAFHWLAVQAKIPPLKSVSIEVHQTCPDRRRPDTAAILPACKAALDGALVDTGILEDDGPDYVTYIGFYAPVVGDGHSLTIVVKEDQ